MQRPNESGWIGRVVLAVRALFGGATSAAAAPIVAAETPLPTIVWSAIDADATTRAPAPRMLAARLAIQAKLNVPLGKTARVAPIVSARTTNRRPVEVAIVKRSPQARSVYLQARHLAAKATPKSRANVVALPVAKIARPMSKPIQARPHRIAA